MADSPEAIKKAVRTYLFVGAILFIGTIFTVLVATYPPFDIGDHGFDKYDCILGLAVATVKATLVGAIFMHLNHEKKAVYWLFGSGVAAVISLAGLTALAMGDPIFDRFFYSGH
jgi:caa(3)-type oxidase subunit IV